MLKKTGFIITARAISTACLVASLVLHLPKGASAGSNYEVTHPPHTVAAPAGAESFYLEFRARNEVAGFGHSYVTLGAIDASNHSHQTFVAGFVPRSADDDYWSKFGLPVTGLIGVTRSDLLRQPDARGPGGYDQVETGRVAEDGRLAIRLRGSRRYGFFRRVGA